MSDSLTLPEIVEVAFNRAVASPSIARWRSVSIMARCAAVKLHGYHAAALEGVAEEANRRMFAMQSQREEETA